MTITPHLVLLSFATSYLRASEFPPFVGARTASDVPSEIIIFAKVFHGGCWSYWEHKCTGQEIGRVVNSARTKASDRRHLGQPLPIDYFEGVRYAFTVARGTLERPREGDSVVYGATFDGFLIGTVGDQTVIAGSPQA